MIILGVPDNINDYIMVDNPQSFILQQKGFHPLYRDGKVFYFKKNSKLQIALDEINLEF